MQCEYFALEGLSDLVNTIKQVHANLNPQLRDHRHPARHVRRPHHAAGAGERAAQVALRRQGVRHRDSAQRPARRGAELRHARRSSSIRAPRARWRSSSSPARWRRASRPCVPPDVAAGFDPALLARIEDAGINASAPREQRWVDGWLVRFSPGKAKRARCIQAVAPGRLTVAEKLARCLPLYAAAGLRPFVRITPFSEPARPRCDAGAARMGAHRRHPRDGRDGTLRTDAVARRLSRSSRRTAAASPRGSARLAVRPSPSRRRTPSASLRSPVPYRALLVHDVHGEPVAGGQIAAEGDVAGLYDVFSHEDARGLGLGAAVCAALLGLARDAGAAVGLPSGGRVERCRPTALPQARLRGRLRLPLPGAARLNRRLSRPVVSSMPRWMFID